jgi:hypothetical protein
MDHILYLTAHPLWAEDFIFDYKQRTRAGSHATAG